MSARRNGNSVVRRDNTERLDQAAEFDELHALSRHDPLSGGAADRAIVVVAAAGADQCKGLSGVGSRMVALAMFIVIVMAALVLADIAGRIAMNMVAMHVAVQHAARGAGRQIDDRQQTGCQAISK
jgi:hypothetical protein